MSNLPTVPAECRWSDDSDAFELRCRRCREWWPLTWEFWRYGKPLTQCWACLKEVQRGEGRVKRARRTPAQVARDNAYQRDYRRVAHAETLAYAAEYREQNRELIREKERTRQRGRAA